MLETSIKCVEREEADKQEQRERGNRKGLWSRRLSHNGRGTEHRKWNEKQEEVEPPPNPSLHSLSVKLDLRGLH